MTFLKDFFFKAKKNANVLTFENRSVRNVFFRGQKKMHLGSNYRTLIIKLADN